MKLLLLGANGQLGRSFVDDGGLATRGDLVAATRDGWLWNGERAQAADLGTPGLLALLERERPDVIINAAAYTAVDRAEQDGALAMLVNGTAVGVLGVWAASNDALILHYSTDYVFDGRATAPYPVDAPTAPLGAYGRSKLAGEVAIRASGADHLILRTSWVYAPHGHNFLRTILRLGAEREELRVVADQFGAPTSTALIVRASLAAIDRWFAAPGDHLQLCGTHHLVASGHTSWHGFACAIFDEARTQGLVTAVPRVTPIATSDYPTPARRPAWSVLDNAGFQQRIGIDLPNWKDGLREVMETLAAHRPTLAGTPSAKR